MSNKKTNWRVAKDPKTGREYYYNKVTKESTWTKPMELSSDTERHAMENKKRETSAFFKEMESNIHKTFEDAKNINDFDESLFIELRDDDMYEYHEEEDNYHDNMDGMLSNSVNSFKRDGNIEDYYDTKQRRGSLGGIRLVRTISSIDDDIMEMMKRSKNGTGNSDFDKIKLEGLRGFACSPNTAFQEFLPGVGSATATAGIAMKTGTTPPTRTRGNSREAFASLMALPSSPSTTRKRRNSTGTLYIDSTMSQQDNKATMRCVCAVIREHMIDAEKENIVPRPEFNIFKDEYFVKLEKQQKRQAKSTVQHEASPEIGLCAADRQLPTLATVVTFFENTFSKSQMESMIMASKVWDDLSMWNVDFSQISESFDLQRINELELAMLDALDYEVKVPAGEYAKYYFHLRSMIARLGYHRRRKSELLPLNVGGARKLQLATEEYANTKMTDADSKEGGTRNRARTLANDTPLPSMGMEATGVPMTGKIGRYQSTDSGVSSEHHKQRSVVLEHLLHSTHIHGDGENSVAAKKRTLLTGDFK